MSDLLAWPLCNRIAYFREVWKKLAARAGDRPIAIFGAGQHTRAFLPVVLGAGTGPRVTAILDDAAGTPGFPRELAGIPVRHPTQAPADSFALAVVSSDSMEERLYGRAREWSGGAAPVVRLYADDFADLYRIHRARSRHIWGTTLTERNGHLPMAPDEPVLRLPRRPSRDASSPLPLPSPELRAGYSPGDDALYLRSGAHDVARIRAMVSRCAPDAGPIRRVLDWGCSSGRTLRHWSGLVADGGEAWGCDICATSLNWAAENLAPPFRFFQCTTRPPLPLPDASMDLVYGISVFTHIRELVDTWLMELRRVVRPGGLVVATILDETWWDRCAADPNSPLRKRCAAIDFSAPLEDDFVCHGGAFDPVTFWHTEGIRRRWSFAFDVAAFEPGLVPYQTGVLLRRPG
jgi:ubiquinone/menaquinone biosynthesis C-methylase UbiE